MRLLNSASLLLLAAAPLELTAQEPASFEPPLVGGYLAGYPDGGLSLRLTESGTSIEAAALGVSTVEPVDPGGVLQRTGDALPAAGRTVTLYPPPGLRYGAIELRLTAGRPPAQVAGHPVQWVGDGPMFATLNVEIYTGDRAEVEAWLADVRPLYETNVDCPEGETPRPIHALAADLDGDGNPEGLTTVASSLAPDWFCRWTEVHALAGATGEGSGGEGIGGESGSGQAQGSGETALSSYGRVAHGWPYVSVITANAPGQTPVNLVASHFECCDLDQTFTVSALRDGRLVPVFANSDADGRAGYGYIVADGFFGAEIRFTTDQAVYNYGAPADPAALDLYRFDGTAFTRVPPAGEGEVCATWDRTLVRDCLPGMTCCYGCGIQGCDSFCMADAELLPFGGMCPPYP